MFRRLLLTPLLLAAASLVGAPVPQWLQSAALRPVPPQPPGAGAIVLLDELVVTVHPDANYTSRHRFAVRLLNRAGFGCASGAVDYQQSSGAVRAADAWLLRAGKEVRPPKRRDWIDASDSANGAVYDESRSRVISFADLVIDGDVFGFETTVEEKLLFSQVMFVWEGQLPVQTRRFTLNLPAGWTCDPLLDGPQAGLVIAEKNTDSWTWTMLEQAYRPDEPALPAMPWRDARLMITFRAPAGVASPPAFKTWAELAEWDLYNSAGQCDTGPVLAATVRKLTEGCSDSLARIRALGRYVQQLRYVAVNKGIARGMGYRPRKATEVHAKGWGDCKDKANLLAAMLREAGVGSHPVSAMVGGGRMVNETWPSAVQFNHAILAIEVDDMVTLPAVVNVPGVGRLLFFDPTDADVLVGDLSQALQGTKVQVLCPGNAGLTILPLLPLDPSHRFETRVELALVGAGVVGKCSFGGPARAGALLRTMARMKSEKEQRTLLVEMLNAGLRGAQIQDVATTDDLVSGERRMSFSFAAPNFGQHMPGGLVLLRLDVLGRTSVPALPAKERKMPIGLEPVCQRDEIVMSLPAGYAVEEMPEKVELSSAYGRYTNSVERKGDTIIVRRELRLEDLVVPVGEYAALRKFLVDVAKADHSSLVLRHSDTVPTPAK